MTIPYESKGLTKQLGGPTSVGFNPVKVADSTSAMEAIKQDHGQIRSREIEQFGRNAGIEQGYLQQKKQEVAQNSAQKEQDLTALLSLSQTATRLLVDTQKARNENEYKLGVADMLNGYIKPKQKAVDEYRANTSLLNTEAANTGAAINRVETVEPAAAQQMRIDDPTLSGWRQYGRAVGAAQKAAADAPMVLKALMADTEENIPIVQADGSVKMISAAGAQGPVEINAAWEVSLQRFIEKSGVANLNPILLSERLTPTILSAKPGILEASLERSARAQKAEAKFQLDGKLAKDLDVTDLTDPAAVNDVVSRNIEDRVTSGISLREEAVEQVGNALIVRAVASGNPDILEAMNQIQVNPNDPDDTLGARFVEKIFAAYQQIDRNKEEIQEREEKNQQEALKEYESAIMEALSRPEAQSPEARGAILMQAEADLTSTEYESVPGVTDLLVKIRSMDRRYTPENVKQLEAMIRKDPFAYSAASIDATVARGDIKAEEGAMLKKLLPEDTLAPLLKEYGTLIKQTTEGAFVSISQQIKDPAERKAVLAPAMAEFERRMNVVMKSWLYANRNDPNMAEKAAGFIQKAAEDLFMKPEFAKIEMDSKGRWKGPPLSKDIGRMTHGTGGETVPVMDRAAPIEIRSMRANPKKSPMLSEAEIQAAKEALSKGTKVPKRVNDIAHATGQSVEKLIELQGGEETPRTKLSERLRTSAAGDALLNNPNATPFQIASVRFRRSTDARIAARKAREEAEAKAAAQGASTGIDGGSSGLPTGGGGEAAALFGLRDALSVKESGDMGYNAANMGVSGDTKGGVPGLENMTIAQVQQLQAKGYYAMGRYQIIPGTLKEAMARTGLKPTDKFNKANQDRLANDLIRNRKPLWNYITGKSNNLDAAVFSFGQEWEAYDEAKYPENGPMARQMLQRARTQMLMKPATGSGNFSKSNVTSIRIETPGPRFQPGIDLYFEDKQFPALLDGQVKEIRYNNGNYGNMIVVSSISPISGKPVDVLYAHLGPIHAKKGQRVRKGTILGRQGNTGRVVDADSIASIDFLAPAPAGSNSMTPYENWNRLAQTIATGIETGKGW